MPKPRFPLKLTAILIISVVLTAFFIYWLWQRQPKGLTVKEEQISQASQESNTANTTDKTVKITVENNKIVTNKQFRLQGKTQPNSQIVIFSNTTQAVAKSDQNGNFSQDISLDPGLNLIAISTLGPDNTQIAAANLTYFLSQTQTAATAVYSGLVKNIFENTITLTTQNGERTVKKEGSTKVNIPKLPGVETKPGDNDIRVGDYMIALGQNTGENQLAAQAIDILRDNKPQNTRHFSTVKILTALAKNTFSVTEQGKTDTVKVLIDKNTKYQDQGKQADEKIIIKNKQAIIIFHQDEKANDIADLVYLLP